MEINIEELKKKYQKKTKADIIDAEEMRVIIPVLLRENASLEAELLKAEEYINRLEAKRPALSRKGKSGKAKWEVEYQPKKNRIYLKLEGTMNSKSAKKASNTIVSIVSYVEKDFDVINDVRLLEPTVDLRVLFHLRKVQYSLKNAGVRSVVRVIDQKKSVVSEILNKSGYKFFDNIQVVSSVEEAHNVLDNPENLLKT